MSASAPPRPPVYGRYELIERIGAGGMAEVYRAESTAIGGFRKPVALKRMLAHLSTDAELLSLFIAEAKLSVSLAHGNVVEVLDFGRVDNCYFLAMELVEGWDLTRILVRQARLGRAMAPEVALFVMINVLRGLAHAHGRRGPDGVPLGIVHRDVSPHNVLVSFEGEVKLADFGIATVASQARLTRPGLRLGKLSYMSPEQARGEPVDARTDLWAAGVTLFECLTGRRLFHSDDPARVLAAVRNPVIPRPSSIEPSLDPKLDALVLSALELQKEDRPPHARAYAAELQSELHRIAPGFDDTDLIRYLRQLLGSEVGLDRFPDVDADLAPVAQPLVRADTRADSAIETRFDLRAAPHPTAELDRLFAEMEGAQDLWPLTGHAERWLALDRAADGWALLRMLAAKHAQAGDLARAVAQLLRAPVRGPAFETEVAALPRLVGISNAVLLERAPQARPELSRLLAEIAQLPPMERAASEEEGLLDGLDGPELSRLAELLELRRVSSGEDILREGQAGDEMFVIVRGRVLVHCTSFHGQRTYLAALSEGEAFGEMSFFTREPRAATVEAFGDVELLVISRARLVATKTHFPRLYRAVKRFFRRRMTSTLLAKSEVFGALPAKDRQWLVGQLELVRASEKQVILQEGELGDDVFIIASGEVEVSRGPQSVFLDKLRRGEVFGESAALAGTPRTARVSSLGPVELLRLTARDLRDLCARSPDIRRVLEAQIRRRDAEALRRLTGGGAFI